jgi:hypothetical protein
MNYAGHPQFHPMNRPIPFNYVPIKDISHDKHAFQLNRVSVPGANLSRDPNMAVSTSGYFMTRSEAVQLQNLSVPSPNVQLNRIRKQELMGRLKFM